MSVNFQVVEVHVRKGEKKSTIAPDSRAVPVTVWDVTAVSLGTDTNYQLTVSTTDPNEGEKYRVGDTIKATLYPSGGSVVQLNLGDNIVVGDSVESE